MVVQHDDKILAEQEIKPIGNEFLFHCYLFPVPLVFCAASVCKGHSRPPHPTVKPSAERMAVSVVSAMLMTTLQRFLLSWVIMVWGGLEGSCHAACG